MHSRAGTLPVILPTKKVNIYSINTLYSNPLPIALGVYRMECLDDIKDVGVPEKRDGTFPIGEITGDWKSCDPDVVLYRILLRARVSSGTYIRSIVHDTGQSLGIPAHAFRITRTSSG